MKKYFNRIWGFSLAEMLIVLGIVGVISALIIPSLIGNYEVSLSISKYKKNLAVLNQMGKLAKTELRIFSLL